MGLDKLVRSKGYKQFMAKLYGIGASVVILGAMCKILHWPGANLMIVVGMTTEAIIFLFSAFEPLHVEYNWALVYPELAVGEDESAPKDKKKLPQGTPTQQLDRMLEDAKIGPDLIESLAKGMRNLSENANKLSGVADAATVTNGYVGNLTKAAESVRNLSLQYDKTAEALKQDSSISDEYLSNVKKAATAVANLTNIYENTTKSMQSDTGSYNDQLTKLNQNLASINNMYEMQLKNSKDMLENYQLVEKNLQAYAKNMNDSLANTEKYKLEIDKLTKNVAMLSSVYGNMLAAMNVNKG
ncbi:MAG: gliding motility protein GldL [Bacteroidales bacterium]|jgi:gliding motility-associated protein GldL|nr:gliding motility protein GldL [Bacteroidales bacterium]